MRTVGDHPRCARVAGSRPQVVLRDGSRCRLGRRHGADGGDLRERRFVCHVVVFLCVWMVGVGMGLPALGALSRHCGDAPGRAAGVTSGCSARCASGRELSGFGRRGLLCRIVFGVQVLAPFCSSAGVFARGYAGRRLTFVAIRLGFVSARGQVTGWTQPEQAAGAGRTECRGVCVGGHELLESRQAVGVVTHWSGVGVRGGRCGRRCNGRRPWAVPLAGRRGTDGHRNGVA